MSLNNTIIRVRAGLKWHITEEIGNSPDFTITSDPWARTHTIRRPASGDMPRDMEYRHELAHAWLAEHVHPLLSTAYFRRGISQDSIEPLVSPKRCAADWFADALLRTWCPRKADREVIEHLGYVFDLAGDAEQDISILYGGGLVVAQAVHWNLKRVVVPPIYRPVVDILLAFPPEKPSITKMRTLINRLAALTTDLRVAITHDDGIEVWDLIQRGDV